MFRKRYSKGIAILLSAMVFFAAFGMLDVYPLSAEENSIANPANHSADHINNTSDNAADTAGAADPSGAGGSMDAADLAGDASGADAAAMISGASDGEGSADANAAGLYADASDPVYDGTGQDAAVPESGDANPVVTLTATDNKFYTITVSYNSLETQIPADAVLMAEPVTNRDPRFAPYMTQTAALLREKWVSTLSAGVAAGSTSTGTNAVQLNGQSAGVSGGQSSSVAGGQSASQVSNYLYNFTSPDDLRLFDIRLVSGTDGVTEYEPAEGTKVNVTIRLHNENEAVTKAAGRPNTLATGVVHFNENSDVMTAAVTQVGADMEYKFDTDGFSLYGMATVDFTYDGFTYHIPVGSEILLSALFAELGISENAAEAQEVWFSNNELIVVEQIEGDWKLTSTIPFQTEELLRIVMANGTVYEVQVTDAMETYEPASSLENGGEYLIVSSNANGTAYALQRNGTGVTKTQVTISGGKISLDNSSCVWQATTSGNSFTLKNGTDSFGSKYGTYGGWDIVVGSGATNVNWTYNSGSLQNGSAERTLRYYNNNFVFNQYSQGSNVYLFKKAAPADPVTNITLSPTSITDLPIGQTSSITETVSPSTAQQTVSWTSSNPAIATVNNSGVVTGISAGTVTITAAATDESGVTATCSVTVVSVPISSISLSDASVGQGSSVTITPSILPANASNKTLSWTSSNTSVATVNNSGVVSGISAGTTTITATATDGSGVFGSCTVTVTGIVTYRRVSAITNGKNYLIASAGSTSAYLLRNDNGSVGRSSNSMSITRNGNDYEINTAATDVVWTATNTTNAITLKNGNYYLNQNNGTLVLDPSTACNWSWNSANNRLTTRFNSRDYYLRHSSNNFGISTTIGSVYIFEEVVPQYEINITAPTNGTVTSDKATAAENEVVTLTVTPVAGYMLDTLTVVKTNDSSPVTVTNNQFTMPAGAVTVTATFVSAPTYSITVSPTTNGTVSAPASASVGSTVSLTVTPNQGYELASITVTKTSDGSTVTVTNNSSFEMPASNVTISATFQVRTTTIYKLVSEVQDGKNYLIVSTNGNGGASALTLNGSAFGKETVTIASSEIEYDGTVAVWAVSGTSSSFQLSNGGTRIGAYPSYAAGNLAVEGASGVDQPIWNWSLENNGQNRGAIIGNYYRAICWNGSNFIFGDAAAGGNSRIYFFEEQEPVVQTYTVTWKNQDGTDTLETDTGVSAGAQPSFDGTTPTKNPDAQYTYTFAGWATTTNAESGVAASSLPTVSGDVTYYAAFSKTLRSYTVTWKSQDGETTLEADTNVSYGTVPSFNSAQPTKAADAQYTYTFAGWATSANQVTGTAASSLPTVSGDVIYYAAFSTTTNTYTVTWKNYNDAVLETDLNVPYGTIPTYDSTTPVKPSDGVHTYTFSGWSPAVEPITGDTIYTAQFSEVTYTVSFNMGGYGTQIAPQQVSHGGTVTKPTDPTASGYTFLGWYADSSYNTPFDFDNTTITEDTTIYAQWHSNVTLTYSIPPAHSGTTPDPVSGYGWVTIASGTGLVAGEGSFVCWNPAHLDYGPLPENDLYPGDMFYLDHDITLHALYGHTITYDLQGHGSGSIAPTQGVVHKRNSVRPTDPEDPHYDFRGWFSERGLIDPYIFGGLVQEDRTIYAKWEPKEHTITYLANGGTGTMAPTTGYHYGDTNVPLSPNEFTNTGYVFTGWNTTADGSGDSYADGERITLLDNLTLYAQWKHSVTFNMNGVNGSPAPPVQYVVDGGYATEPATDPSATGYTFDDWYTDNTGTTLFDFTAPITTNTIIYAKWTSNANNLIIENRVTGAMGDSTKDFHYTVSGLSANTTYITVDASDTPSTITTNASGACTFNLRGGQSYEIHIPTTVTNVGVAQTNYSSEGYQTSYVLDSGSSTTGYSVPPLTMSSDHTVTFTNTKAAVSPTAYRAERTAYVFILLLGGGVLAACLLLWRRGKRQKGGAPRQKN